VLEMLRQSNISVVTNLKQNKMSRIARYTQTIISPSPNVLDNSFVLGKCKKFYIDKSCGRSSREPASSRRQTTDLMVTKESGLMCFEGCNPSLGCTICLTGNFKTELDHLRVIKGALREMLALARNVVLEKTYLFYGYCKVD